MVAPGDTTSSVCAFNTSTEAIYEYQKKSKKSNLHTVDSTYNELAHNEFWVITTIVKNNFLSIQFLLFITNTPKQTSIITNVLTYDVCVKPKMAVFIILKPKLLDQVDKGRKENGICDEFSVEKSTLSTINILFYVILIL